MNQPIAAHNAQRYATHLLSGAETARRLLGTEEGKALNIYVQDRVQYAAAAATADVREYLHNPNRSDLRVQRVEGFLARQGGDGRPPSPHRDPAAPLAQESLQGNPATTGMPVQLRPQMMAYVGDAIGREGNDVTKVAEAWSRGQSDEAQRGVGHLDTWMHQHRERQEASKAQQMLSGTPAYDAPQPPASAPGVAQSHSFGPTGQVPEHQQGG